MANEKLIADLQRIADDNEFTYIPGHWQDIRDIAAAAVAALNAK